MVLRAAKKSDPASRQPLAELCEIYWYPLYVFVRRRGFEADEAMDLTQGYFVNLIDRDLLDSVDPERGEFRGFLLATMKHHISHTKRAERTLKRGGATSTLSLDAERVEKRYRMEPVDERTPEQAFEGKWALTVVDQARRRLRQEIENEGNSRSFALLEPLLTDDAGVRPYAELAGELGTTEGSVKMAVLRLRRRFGQVLRAIIAETVDRPDRVDQELKHLLAVLRDTT
jgi:RNA polymerase sigma-70 factor (ECF subfamily)